jgi:ABC-type transport system involved in Fe-S cluster assembly, permease component
VSAQAYASFDEATVITVPAEADASRPTVVTVTATGALDTVTCWCRPSRSPGPWSCSTPGQRHLRRQRRAGVGDSASLSVVSLQDWADDAVHLTHHYATLGRDARLRHAAVTLGGNLVRLAPRSGTPPLAATPS